MDYLEFLQARIDESDPGLLAVELEQFIVDLHASTPGGSPSCEECGTAWPCQRLLWVSRAHVHHPDFPTEFPSTWAS